MRHYRSARIDPSAVGFQVGLQVSIQKRPLLLRGPKKTDTTRQAIKGQGGGADEFGKTATGHTVEQFELEGAILPVAKADAKGTIGFGSSDDKRDTIAIAVDVQRSVESCNFALTRPRRQTFSFPELKQGC